MNRVISFDDSDRRHELGALEPGQRWHEPDLPFAENRRIERELVEDRANRVRRNELSLLSAGHHGAAAPKLHLGHLVELARPVHAHDVRGGGRGADPEDARDAGVPRARTQFQLPERLVIEASEIAIVNPRRDRRFRDGDVEIVPGAVDHAIPALQLADEGGLIAGVDRDRDRTVIPLRSRDSLRLRGVPPGDADPLDPGTREKIRDRRLGHRAVSAQDEDLHRAPGAPVGGASFTDFAVRSDLRHERGRENRAAGEDQGHARVERHRGYTAIEVAWLAMYTAKISGAPSPYDCFKKIGKNP